MLLPDVLIAGARICRGSSLSTRLLTPHRNETYSNPLLFLPFAQAVIQLCISSRTHLVFPLLPVQPPTPGYCFCLWLSPVIPVSNLIPILRAAESLQKVSGSQSRHFHNNHKLCWKASLFLWYFHRNFHCHSKYQQSSLPQNFNCTISAQYLSLLWNFLSCWIWKRSKMSIFPWIKNSRRMF